MSDTGQELRDIWKKAAENTEDKNNVINEKILEVNGISLVFTVTGDNSLIYYEPVNGVDGDFVYALESDTVSQDDIMDSSFEFLQRVHTVSNRWSEIYE